MRGALIDYDFSAQNRLDAWRDFWATGIDLVAAAPMATRPGGRGSLKTFILVEAADGCAATGPGVKCALSHPDAL